MGGCGRSSSTPSLQITPLAVPGLGGVTLTGLVVTGGYAYFTGSPTGGQIRHDVRRINLGTGQVETVAWSANSADAPFEQPTGLCVEGGHLYVADTGNGAIRRVDLATGNVVAVTLRRPQ